MVQATHEVGAMRAPTGSAELSTAASASVSTHADEGPARLGIGDVLEILKEQFPSVTISKIRFLEAEGLVTPQRTAAGYRKFRRADVERLLYILRVQRDHYLPLKVIREHINTLEAGQGYPSAPPAASGRGEPPAVSLRGEGLSITSGVMADPAKASAKVAHKDLLRAAGIDEAMLSSLEEHGFVRPGLAVNGEPEYSNLDVRVASIVRQMRAFGIEPRHLRIVRTTADREAGLIDQAVRPLAHQRGNETVGSSAARLAELSIRLHAALLEGAVRENLADHQD